MVKDSLPKLKDDIEQALAGLALAIDNMLRESSQPSDADAFGKELKNAHRVLIENKKHESAEMLAACLKVLKVKL